MTVHTIYPDADFRVINSDANWTTARNGTGSRTLQNTADNSAGVIGPSYGCHQSFLTFDTSGVPDATPTANVELTLYCGTGRSDTIRAAEYGFTEATSAWRTSNQLDLLPLWGSRAFTSGDSSTWTTITGPADVDRIALYRLVIWGARQQSASAPGTNYISEFRSAEDTGFEPYLTIEIPALGAAAITEANDTLAATGALLIAGALAVTEGDDYILNPLVGTFAVTEADDTLAAAAALALAGAAVVTEADDTLSGVAVLPISGLFAVTEAADTLSAEGIILVPVTTPPGRRLRYPASLADGRRVAPV